MIGSTPGEIVADERGAALPLLALILLVLLGSAAMAIDLGWLFWQSIEIQHGADAAALAGVVYEPDQRLQAHTVATASALQNGFDEAAASTTVAVVDFGDDPAAVQTDGMLRVTITHKVPTFFMKAFGLDDFDIKRTALAEYVLPLALGSPEQTFGNDPATGNEPGFWANINGTYEAKAGGNRYSSACLNDEEDDPCTPNPEWRASSGWGTADALGGYLYGIEVEEGSSAGLEVEIFNGPIYAIYKNKDAPPPATGTGNFAGDVKRNDGWTVNAVTWFMLYGPDPTRTTPPMATNCCARSPTTPGCRLRLGTARPHPMLMPATSPAGTTAGSNSTRSRRGSSTICGTIWPPPRKASPMAAAVPDSIADPESTCCGCSTSRTRWGIGTPPTTTRCG